MSVLIAVPSDGLKVADIQRYVGFQPYPLHAKYLIYMQNYLNLFIIICIVHATLHVLQLYVEKLKS